MIAETLRQRQLRRGWVILDPNLPMLAFDRVYRDAYRDWITYLPQATIRHVDPFARRIQTEFDTVDFHRCAARTTATGRRSALEKRPHRAQQRWQPQRLGRPATHACTPSGTRTSSLIGDQLDRSSTLFGFYPKTGQIAARQGQIVAREIAARAAGETPPRRCPTAAARVIARVSPREMTRIDTTYRFRGDGLIQQTVRQQHIPQAADGDIRQAQAMYANSASRPTESAPVACPDFGYCRPATPAGYRTARVWRPLAAGDIERRTPPSRRSDSNIRDPVRQSAARARRCHGLSGRSRSNS